ncbi:MAG: hypothetical protein Q9191_007634, partial [Dirinaria sp. TL-2023a]
MAASASKQEQTTTTIPSSTSGAGTDHAPIPTQPITRPTSPAPITITIDASIRIVGHCNTVHVPGLPCTPPHGTRSAEPGSPPLDLQSPLGPTDWEKILSGKPSREPSPSCPEQPYSPLFFPLGPFSKDIAVRADKAEKAGEKFEFKLETGVRICGSKNLVV